MVARRVAGTVKRYEVKLGYGFITRGDTRENIFVHQSDIVKDGFRSLCVGEKVEFDIAAVGRKGSRAICVTGPDRAPVRGAPDAAGDGRKNRKKEVYSLRMMIRDYGKYLYDLGEDDPDYEGALEAMKALKRKFIKDALRYGEEADSDSDDDEKWLAMGAANGSLLDFETIQDYLCWKDGMIDYGASALDLLDSDED